MLTQAELRESHPYHMYDAVLAQPDAIERVLLLEAGAVRSLAGAVSAAERVHLVGIGTSWHAALVGASLLRTVGRRPDARAWNAHDFCTAPPPLTPRDLVVVMSHRGTKRYPTQALAIGREAGASTAAVTGIGSALADGSEGSVDFVVRTAPQERSAAFTVSHATALTALAMLAVEVGGGDAEHLRPALDQLHVLIEWAIASELSLRRLAEEISAARLLVFAGAGANAATAYEAALKVSEASHMPAVGYEVEQFLHGPFVVLEPTDVVVAVLSWGPARERTLSVVSAAGAAGAHTVVLADEADREALATARTPIPLPAVPEPLSPIAYLGPVQLLAYWLAVSRGRNPDLFRLDDPAHGSAREHYTL